MTTSPLLMKCKAALFSMLLLAISHSAALAQVTPEGAAKLKADEDTLRYMSSMVMQSDSDKVRVKACYAMIPKLVDALKTPGSFKYPFTSLESMSILYPKDSTFRIFNWMLPRSDGSYRYFAAIQKDDLQKLELIPLFDRSDSIFKPFDTVLTDKSWFGALYYNIYEVSAGNKKYYMLFGWDGNDMLSTKKILDVMYFDDKGKVKFGAPIFDLGKENTRHPKRIIMEYKKDASASLNYSEEHKMIVFDHLKSESEGTGDVGFTLIPDGSYDGFKWKKDHWEFVDNVFKDVVDDKKQTPVPFPQGSHSMTQPNKKP